MRRRHEMPFGARIDADGSACFRLWAPGAQRVELLRPASAGVDPRLDSLRPCADGWFELQVAQAVPGQRYAYRIDGGTVVPDPASRWNPDDVHQASALVDPLAFDWPDDGWCGRPWHEAVIYELHVGCFTPAGTFVAAIERLDHLVALGITAIELMPVADFPGRRGWGYDGVLPFAPESSYGSPDDLKRLVAAAHARGLMVLLDVVYNHFGPDGNYLHVYAGAFFNPRVATPWGAAIDFDGKHSRTVRDFFIHNARYWIDEFHLDGLRIDAVHAMHDTSVPHFIDELAQVLRADAHRGRPVHLVLENHANDASHLARDAAGQARLADAQWNDDVHHAMHVLATGETDGYYVDYADDPLQHLGRGLAEGFVYQGEASVHGGGLPRGTPSAHLSPLAFVNALQTHDQIGNRADGERIGELARAAGRDEALRALLACLLLAPAPPMLFMGEEWAASTPFLYFCDFAGELARAVTEGRRSEFSSFARFADPAARAAIADPNAEATFRRSRLDWDEPRREPHAGWLALTTRLLQCRREHLVPQLAGARSGRFDRPSAHTLRLHWPLGAGPGCQHWHLLANLGPDAGPGELARDLCGTVVYRSHHAAEQLPAWSVLVALEAA